MANILYNDVYETIKARQSYFPIPAPEMVIDIGTFDVPTGKLGVVPKWVLERTSETNLRDPLHFDPEVPRVEELIEHLINPGAGPGDPIEPAQPAPPPPSGTRRAHTLEPRISRGTGSLHLEERERFDVLHHDHSRTMTMYYRYDTEITAVRIFLRLRVTNAPTDFSLKCAATVTQTGEWHTIDLSGTEQVSVGLGAHLKVSLKVPRPAILGIGVFTLPFVPISILYEPAMGINRANFARYSQDSMVGTTIGTAFSQEESTTKAAGTEFDDLMQFQGAVSALSKVSSYIPKVGEAISGALSVLTSALGSASATVTKGTTDSVKHTTKQTFRMGSVNATAERLGPGRGDLILCLTDVRMVWMSTWRGGAELAVLGAGGYLWRSAEWLSKALTQPPGQLDHETIQALLALDPYATNPAFDPAKSDRFVLATDGQGVPAIHDLGGAQHLDIHVVHTVEASDTKAQAEFRQKVVDYTAGFLSFLGVGPSESKKVTSSTRAESSVELFSENSRSVDFHIETASGEIMVVAIYYDRVFNTFVAHRLAAEPSPVAAGVVCDERGAPMAHHLVRLTTEDGHTFTAQTDAEGRFAFHASAIKPTDLVLTVGTRNERVHCGGQRRTDLTLRG